MADKDTLWAHVKTVYEPKGLATLTNLRTRSSASTIDDDVGTAASQSVIDLWPIYAQEDFDVTDATHLEVAAFGVIALLWRRGGSSTSIEQVKWDEVFGDGGLIEKVRRTAPRGRQGPSSNSGVQQAAERASNGSPVRGWSDRESLPVGYMPLRRASNYEE